MLSLMRKNVKSWFIKVALFAIIVVFTFWGVGTFQERKANIIATVDEEAITYNEYRQHYQNLTRLYREKFGDEVLRALNIENMALNNLISQALFLKEAKKLHLKATDDELRESISKNPIFQKNEGIFDKDLYIRILRNYFRQTPQEYEEGQKKAISIAQASGIITDSLKVSEKEAFNFYCFQNEKINLEYIRINPEKFKEKVSSTQEEIETYFNAHKEEFRIPGRVKALYLSFSPKLYEERIEIFPEKIEDYYQLNIEKFSEPEKIRARHIFILNRGIKEGNQGKEEALERAKNILAEVRKGKESFSDLAIKYSDSSSAEEGGDLGYLKKGDMEKAFEDVAFSLTEGEVSSLVETRFGFHIIKAEEVKEATAIPLEKVRKQIINDLKKEKSRELLDQEIGKIYGQIFKTKNLNEYGKKNNLSVQSTGFFALNEAISGIGRDGAFSSAAFSLEIDAISSPIKSNDTYYIIQPVERKNSRIPELNEVKEKVRTAGEKEKAKEFALKEANTILSRLKEGKDIKNLAEERGLKVEETGFFFRRLARAPKIEPSPELKEMILTLTSSNPYPETVLEANKNFFIIKLKEKKGVEEKNFNSQKNEIKSTLLQKKQEIVLSAWIESLKKKTDININKELFRF